MHTRFKQCFIFHLQGSTRSLSDEQYNALFEVLTGAFVFKDWPKHERHHLRQSVYRKYKLKKFAAEDVHDPTIGKPRQRIIHVPMSKIVLRESECEVWFINTLIKQKEKEQEN